MMSFRATSFVLCYIIVEISTAFMVQPASHEVSRLLYVSNGEVVTTRVNLPPRENEHLTRLEQEFRDKLSAFAAYSYDQIASIPNPRLRKLYEGVAASAHEPAVYRAFEVLFEDLAPLRVAGRMIFGTLAENMDAHYERRNALVLASGWSKETVDQYRQALVNAVGSDHEFMSKSQLKSIVNMVNDHLGEDLDVPKGRVSQETFLLCLAQKTSDPLAILHMLEPNHTEDGKKLIFEKRYDDMVYSFAQWENYMPHGTGRRIDIVRGCFVGAKNEKVLEALKIVYVDYSALRFAGDLIFKLASAIMHNRGATP